ncbi:hypothetical protein HZA98_00425 [Candidatus Woesearchaeota archaeon]|nr:hypothetical protein [Candidatus Woesearchaeota archaeon]
MKKVKEIKAPENYEWIRTKWTHIKEYACDTCHSHSTEPIKCCGEKMKETHKHGKWDLKGCC